MDSELSIPSWFIVLQGIITPILTLICGAALKVLWGMRQELTTINVKIEITKQLQTEISTLWNLVRKLERNVDRLSNGSSGDVKVVRDDD